MAKINISQELRKAKACERKGQVNEAVAIYEAILVAYPKNERVRQALDSLKSTPLAGPSPEIVNGMIRDFQSGKFLAVFQQAGQLVKKHVNTPQLWNLLALSAGALGNHKEACRAFGELTRLLPSDPVALANYGLSCSEIGEFAQADIAFKRSLELKPGYVDALNWCGLNALKQKDFVKAENCFSDVLKNNPDNIDAMANLAALAAEDEQLGLAKNRYKAILEKAPNNLNVLNNLANVLEKLSEFQDAKGYLLKALDLSPRHPDILNNFACICRDLKEFDQAEEAFQKAISIRPKYAEAICNLGGLYLDEGKLEQARQQISEVFKISPDFAMAYNVDGMISRKQGNLEVAAAKLKKAITLQPENDQFYNDLAVIEQDQGNYVAAIALAEKAIYLNPLNPHPYANLANIYIEMDDLEAAASIIEKAIVQSPSLEVHFARGVLFAQQGNRTSALQVFKGIVDSEKDFVPAIWASIEQQVHICDWSGVNETLQLVNNDLTSAFGQIAPFVLLGLVDDPAYQMEASKAWNEKRHTGLRSAASVVVAKDTSEKRKIRIGYFSSDFYDHATMYLMAGLFAHHDRSRFEIYVYSYGANKTGEMRENLISKVDHFYDIHDLSDQDAANLAKTHHLDIAVDLKGYTQGARSRLLGYRLAPVQMNYLGYPGTMAADFIDYIIADETVIPETERQYYSEKIIYLPNSYQPNDNQRKIANTGASRVKFGLPENGFVLCCFNQNYKITSDEFAIWMRILGQVDDAVLWLLGGDPLAEDNLRSAAQATGIDPNRIVFAQRLPQQEHLERCALADLFVDTFRYNAHTTASDALWAGLPVVTLPGRQFSSRVAASLLKAAGLPELVVESPEGYEALVLELLSDREKLLAVRKKLAANKMSCSLFDTVAYTKHLETAFDQAFAGHQDGRQVDDIKIPL